MPTVLLFGTFDIIHDGHRDLFRQAKQYGNLHIVLARDETILQVKGRYPYFGEQVRKQHLEIETAISTVYYGSLTDKYQCLKDIQPDYIFLGYDQQVFVDRLESKLHEFGLKASIIRGTPYQEHRCKSSLLRAEKEKLKSEKKI